MDEDEQAGDRRRQERQQKRTPQYKYKNLLQKLANRTIHEITVDLDDLAEVCSCTPLQSLVGLTNSFDSGRKHSRMDSN